MKTTIISSLTLAFALVSAWTLPALAQGAPQVEVPIACLIDYADIGISGAGIPERELVLDGPGQSAVANLVGTPPDEKIQLVCTDSVGPQPRPISRRGFGCQVFRGRRGDDVFVVTTDTSIAINRQGAVTMRCNVG